MLKSKLIQYEYNPNGKGFLEVSGLTMELPAKLSALHDEFMESEETMPHRFFYQAVEEGKLTGSELIALAFMGWMAPVVAAEADPIAQALRVIRKAL